MLVSRACLGKMAVSIEVQNMGDGKKRQFSYRIVHAMVSEHSADLPRVQPPITVAVVPVRRRGKRQTGISVNFLFYFIRAFSCRGLEPVLFEIGQRRKVKREGFVCVVCLSHRSNIASDF